MIEVESIRRRFELHGKMRPKARPRAAVHRGRVRMHMPADYRSCVNSYRQQLRSQYQVDPVGKFRAVHLEVCTVIKRQKDRPAWVSPELWRSGASFPAPSSVGDVDNMAGTVMDAANGVLWVDDCQVVRLMSSKRFASDESDDVARVVVWMTEAEVG